MYFTGHKTFDWSKEHIDFSNMQDNFHTSSLSGGYWHVKRTYKRSLNRYLFVCTVWWGMGEVVSQVRGKVCVSERQRCVSVRCLRLLGLAYWQATGRRPGEVALPVWFHRVAISAWDNHAHRVPAQEGEHDFWNDFTKFRRTVGLKCKIPSSPSD